MNTESIALLTVVTEGIAGTDRTRTAALFAGTLVQASTASVGRAALTSQTDRRRLIHQTLWLGSQHQR